MSNNLTRPTIFLIFSFKKIKKVSLYFLCSSQIILTNWLFWHQKFVSLLDLSYTGFSFDVSWLFSKRAHGDSPARALLCPSAARVGVCVRSAWSRSRSGVRAKRSGELKPIQSFSAAMRVEQEFEHEEKSANSVSSVGFLSKVQLLKTIRRVIIIHIDAHGRIEMSVLSWETCVCKIKEYITLIRK